MSALLLLTACFDYNVKFGQHPDGPTDTGDSGEIVDTSTSQPPPEDCNGVDDDADGVVDEGFPDDDGNGRADCVDLVCPALAVSPTAPVPIPDTCEGDPGVVVTDPWNIVVEREGGSGEYASISMPIVAQFTDDDGDGDVDRDDASDIIYATWLEGDIVVVDGATGVEEMRVPGGAQALGLVVADITGDARPEIVASSGQFRVFAFDSTGVIAWTSEPGMVFGQPVVADLDGDGNPEVIDDPRILDGQTGADIATLDYDGPYYHSTVVADLDQDGPAEIIMGDTVHARDGTQLWSADLSGMGAFAAPVQADADIEAEVAFASAAYYRLYDTDGSRLTEWYPPGGDPGPPAAADFDGDGAPEIVFQLTGALCMFELDGTIDWEVPTVDMSGLAGVSAWDVEGDGTYEILFAGESSFSVFDGPTGDTLFESTAHASRTLFEYPVVADVDGDGSAEIVIANNMGSSDYTVFGHATNGWGAAGISWTTHDFANVNVGPLGEVPAVVEPWWDTWGLFRARPQVERWNKWDLAVEIADVCVMDCTYGPVAVVVDVQNNGGSNVIAGTPLRLYAIDEKGDRLVAEVALPVIPAGTRLESLVLDLAPADVGRLGFRAVIDPDGTRAECEESNNESVWRDAFCR